MMHSGGAVGGHYYSYIQSFQDNRWYCFNDMNVTVMPFSDIYKAYGEANNRCIY